MPVSIPCPGCMDMFSIPAAAPGQSVVCPTCKLRFLVPTHLVHDAALPPPAPAQPPPLPPIQARLSPEPPKPRSGVRPPPPAPPGNTGVRRPAAQARPPAVPPPADLSAPIPAIPDDSPPQEGERGGCGPLLAVGGLLGALVLISAMAGLVWWLTTEKDGAGKGTAVAAGQPTPRGDATDPATPPGGNIPVPPDTPPQPPPVVKDTGPAPPKVDTAPTGKQEPPPPKPEDKKPPDPAPPPKGQWPAGMANPPPIDLTALDRSDRLPFDVPAAKPDDLPTPPVWEGHSNHVTSVAFTDDGKFVVSHSGDMYEVLVNNKQRPADFSVRVWDARRGTQVHKVENFPRPLEPLAFFPGGRFAAFTLGGYMEGGKYIDPPDAHLRLLDTASAKEIGLDDGGPGPVRARFQGLGGAANCVAVSADRQTVVGCSNTNKVIGWEAKTGKALFNAAVASTPGWPRGINRVQLSPDGRFAVLCADQKVWVLDARTGKELASLTGHQDLVWGVAATVTPDGKAYAVSAGGGRQKADGSGFEPGAKDYAIRVWDLQTFKELRQMTGHEDDVQVLTFRPKTRHLLSCGFDKTVRLWDWETGKLLRTYKGHTKLIRTLAASPDGRAAVSGSDDLTVRYWRLPALPEDLVAALDKGNEAELTRVLQDLDAMGGGLRAAFGPLVRALGGKGAAAPVQVRQALLRYGDLWRKKQVAPFAAGDEEHLAALLVPDNDLELRALGADGLAQLGPGAERAVPALLKMAGESKEPRLVAAAVAALGGSGTREPEAMRLFEKHMDHPDPAVSAAATRGLARGGVDRLSLKQLIVLAGQGDAEVRAAADKALRQKLANPAASDLPALRAGLKSGSAQSRLVFIDAVAALKDEAAPAVGDLAALVAAPEEEVRLAAVRALKRLGEAAKEAGPALARVLTEGKDKKLAMEATVALYRVDPKNEALASKGVALFLEDVGPDANNVQALLAKPLANPAAAALVELGEPAVKPLVQHLLIKNNPKKNAEGAGVSGTAARFLGYAILKEMAKKAAGDEGLTKALLDQDDTLRVFWQPLEQALAARAAQTATVPQEVRDLYVRAAQELAGARQAIQALKK